MGYSPWGRKESDTTERLHFTEMQANSYVLCILNLCAGKYLIANRSKKGKTLQKVFFERKQLFPLIVC